MDDQWGVPGCGVGGDTTTTRRSPFLHFTVVEGRRCKSDAAEGVRSGGRTNRGAHDEEDDQYHPKVEEEKYGHSI